MVAIELNTILRFVNDLNMTLSYVLLLDADARLYNDVHKQLKDNDTEDLIRGKTGMSQAMTPLSHLTRVEQINRFKIKADFNPFETRRL